VEHYQGKPIYYSIGNFIFDPTKPLNAKACIVKVDITKDSVITTPIPVDIKRCVPYLHP
jgi:poly-gamma-glutamate synthesis protein (capsule biosynthesis protein)